jgi:DNA-directed RNA polymerase subunit RPC12/RpoP
MALSYPCPACGQDIEVRFLKAGEATVCNQCGRRSIVPTTAITTREDTAAGVGQARLFPPSASTPGQSAGGPESIQPSTHDLFALARFSSLILHLVAAVLTMILIFGTDTSWLGNPYTLWEVPLAVAILFFLLASAYLLMTGAVQNRYGLIIWGFIFTGHVLLLFLLGLFGLMLLFENPLFSLLCFAFPLSSLLSLLSYRPGKGKAAASSTSESYMRPGCAKTVLLVATVLTTGLGVAEYVHCIPVSALPEAKGTLLLARGDELLAFRPSDGYQSVLRPVVVRLEDIKFVCEAPHGCMLIAAQPTDYDEANRWRFIHDDLKRRLYVYCPDEAGLVSLIDGVRPGSDQYSPIDYSAATGKFIYSGLLHGKKGVYLLDSTFTLIEDLTLLLGDNAETVRFIDSSTFLVWRDKTSYKVSTMDSSSTVVSGERSRAISHDHRWMVVSRGYEENQEHFIIEVHSGQGRELKVGKMNVTQFCFSPDDRYLAFSVRTYTLTDTIVYYIYDLMQGRLSKICLSGSGYGSLTWVELDPITTSR